MAIIVRVVSVVLGYLMLFNNGVDSSMAFSQVLVTTRNKILDQLSLGMGKGGKSISDTLKNTRLRYVVIKGEEPRATFGLDGEILRTSMEDMNG